MDDARAIAEFDASRAAGEGWGLTTDFGIEGMICDLARTTGTTTFADDVAARDFVAAQIRDGSEYHTEAVRILRRSDIAGYKVFREEHPDCAAVTDQDAPLF